MSAREILRFLRDPVDFVRDPVDAAIWRAGYEDIAKPLTDAAGVSLKGAQVEAWEGLAAARVGLILGPPGTGKTHALSWMAAGYLEARRRANLPCRILVTAFTRGAIVNLLEAIAKRSADLAPFRTVFAGRSASASTAGIEVMTPDEAVDLLTEDYVVIGATVWGLNRMLQKQGGLTGGYFHLTCIDEASQMVLSNGLMAIAGMAENGRVLVAGDNKQLPPIRVEHEHNIDGRRLGSSIYDFLQAAGVPEFPFDETFRLNEPLTRFPRKSFYEGRYSSTAPERRLELIPNWREGLQDWEQVALDPDYPVCVLIHDGPPSGASNPFEATLAARLSKALLRRQPDAAGAPGLKQKWAHRLAVVSPHRAQNALIRNLLSVGPEGDDAVVETVDRIQGRERDALVVSYAVADPEFALAEAEFIFSRQRLNVTVTRARSKLILILSRRLLEVVPPDEELVEMAETLREFVLDTRRVDTISLSGPDQVPVPVDIRVAAFDDAATLPKIAPPAPSEREPLEPLQPGDDRILAEIRRLADPKWGTTADYVLARQMHRKPEEIFSDLRRLQRNGLITLDRIAKAKPFWSIRPCEPPRALLPVTPDDLVARVEEVLMSAGRGRRGAPYPLVRNAFDWLSSEGEDLFKPALDTLEAQGVVSYDMHDQRLMVAWARPETAPETPEQPPIEEDLQEQDYVLLNHLEDLEARRINFGVFEDWQAPYDLAKGVDVSLTAASQSLRRLSLHGHIMVAEEGRVRSRMAEMARSVRYVKQRFRMNDAQDRPYLVRGLKVEIRNREKPKYDKAFAPLIERTAAARGPDAPEVRALGLVENMLRIAWRSDAPLLAGFQARALDLIFQAWVGSGDDRFVIAADTGSGKTEAACLPIIAGAIHDHLQGLTGVRALLVYPRVRLAANQAQRLARYLAALARTEDGPLLTLGLQTGAVPETWAGADLETWISTGRTDERRFPFFMCPEPDCGGPLTLTADGGRAGADRLHCRACDWHYDGWIGTKSGLRSTPPNLFLPTTESLHQWLNDVRYGPLFGDQGAPPRCVLADEIHLYTHVQGAQIGYALRRLLARAELNGRSPLAVGMSATLGRPERVWGQLVGGAPAQLITPELSERGRNPKGREYFYFVQPEVESRNRDVAGASTTIQSVMALSHNMRRRHGKDGGFRGLVFVDSIDKLKRLHGAYMDAEEGQNLAALRTRIYPDNVITGAPQRACCGSPLSCDLFRDGECWSFAATDSRQWTARGPYIAGNPLTVAPHPVFSRSSANIESEIQGSDLAFSTASLEVGYDDPEMAFVYQHYAPSNLASFVQRKGRGGRGSDDRPVTGITLSLYSPRDSWFYRRPEALLDSKGFEVPLNLDNPIVSRGQLATLLLDLLARREGRDEPSLAAGGAPLPEMIAEFEALARRLSDQDPFLRLGFCGAEDFVREIGQRFGPFSGREWAHERRGRVAWVPPTLFGAADLPPVTVQAPRFGGGALQGTEDIALTLAAAAPGNATRRWGAIEVHWRMPKPGRVPYLTAAERDASLALELGAPEQLLSELPVDAREDLGDAEVSGTVLQPTRLDLEMLGLMRGGGWTPLMQWDAAREAATPIPDGGDAATGIDARSRGELRGFPVVRVEREPVSLPTGRLGSIASAARGFVGGRTHGSGLHISRLYWGADAELRLVEQAELVGLTQVFGDDEGGAAQLIGYSMETEGVAIQLRSEAIDRFIDGEMERLANDTSQQRMRRNQMLRYMVQRRARNAGVNAYEAHRAAELIVAALDRPHLASDLEMLREMWDDSEFGRLLHKTFDEALSHHPLLSQRRIDRVIASVTNSGFQALLEHVLAARTSHDHLRAFLRSQLVHSLAIRLRQSFVLHGRADERRVVAHVKLPVQFGRRACDVITLAENGMGGDGTSRTFIERAEIAFAEFMDGFAATCPNAAEDALIEAAFAGFGHHARWRGLDPRRSQTLSEIGRDLGVDFDAPDAPSPQHLLRLLFASEIVSGQKVALYDLWIEVMTTRQALAQTLGREPEAWEIVSAAVQAAERGEAPALARLAEGYAAIEGAAQDDSLSPTQRLADQVFRVSAKLCADGCQACLHGDSDLMSSSLAEVSVSRSLLARFLAVSNGPHGEVEHVESGVSPEPG